LDAEEDADVICWVFFSFFFVFCQVKKVVQAADGKEVEHKLKSMLTTSKYTIVAEGLED